MRYWVWVGLVVALLSAGCATHSEGSGEGVIATPLTPDVSSAGDAENGGAQAVQQALAQPVPITTRSAASRTAPSPATKTPGRVVSPQLTASRTGSPALAPVTAGTTEQGAYKKALAAYEAHRSVEAEKQFDRFMTTYPTSKLAPNALYWKAECLYLRGKYADALFVFKDVTARYPRHPKAADALLKAGMSYARLGDADSAKLHYRVLYEDYPDSQAARTGKQLGLNP